MLPVLCCQEQWVLMPSCLQPPCLVTEWCSRGSLYDVLGKAAQAGPGAQLLDWTRTLSMALDAAKVRWFLTGSCSHSG